MRSRFGKVNPFILDFLAPHWLGSRSETEPDIGFAELGLPDGPILSDRVKALDRQKTWAGATETRERKLFFAPARLIWEPKS